MSRRRAFVLALGPWLAWGPLLIVLGGCSTVVYERTRLDAGSTPSPTALTALAPGASKGEVLARLGAPLDVLPRHDGDLFVYRLQHTDVEAFNVNTGIYLAIALPLYSNTSGARRDALVHIYFDRQGRLEYVSRREGDR